MALVANKDINNAIIMLKEKLNECIETQEHISIHGFINGLTVRNSTSLEEFLIDDNKICLTCGWFQINIDTIVLDVQYIDDDYVHIELENGELDIDFD